MRRRWDSTRKHFPRPHLVGLRGFRWSNLPVVSLCKFIIPSLGVTCKVARGLKTMALHVRARLGRVLRLSIRIFCYGFLLSLPITLFPVIWGVQGGVQFHFWTHRQIEENTNAMTTELDQHSSLSYWNVPGAQTIHQFLDKTAPFFIPQLRLMDWTEKLKLSKPSQDDDTGIDRWAALDDLVRPTALNVPGNPTEYWVYITFMPEYSSSPWDVAFSEVIQHAYTNSRHANVGVYYLDCLTSSFLCGVWSVKYPSLVHFTIANHTLSDVESEDATQLSYEYACLPNTLNPVTARVIELPLENEDAVHFLPRNTLPTPYLQLRTLMSDAHSSAIIDHFEPWSPMTQYLRRFQDYNDHLVETPGTYWHHLNKVDRWYVNHILKPVLGKDVNDDLLTEIQSIVFTCTVILAEIVRMPFNLGWYIYTWHLGLGWDGEPMGTHTWPDDESDESEAIGRSRSMWDDMMGDFFNSLAEKRAAESVEAAASAAMTASDPNLGKGN